MKHSKRSSELQACRMDIVKIVEERGFLDLQYLLDKELLDGIRLLTKNSRSYGGFDLSISDSTPLIDQFEDVPDPRKK